MPSLGELFIELGVAGDVKPLEKALGTMKESVKAIEKQISANQRLLKYRQDLASATTKDEKKLIKQNFALEVQKQKQLEEIDATKKNIDSKKELAKNISSVVKGIGLFVGAIAGAAIAINKLTDSLISSNQVWVNFTRQTDLGLKSLQKYAGVASLLDKSLGMEGAAASIADLEQRLFNLKMTGEGAEGFLWAGIDPRGQDATDVLEQLRSRISGMNNEGATFLLNKMGLDPKPLPLLRMSKDEFDALGKTIEKYQLTQDQRESIAKMNVQLGIASSKLQYLKDRAVLALMPLVIKLTESFARVAQGLAHVSKWLTTTKEGTTTLAAAIAGVLIPAVKLLFSVITSHPIIAAISAIITGLYLLIDDIVGYFQGKNSGIGYIINFLKDIGDNLKDIKLPELHIPKWIDKLIQAGTIASKLGMLSPLVNPFSYDMGSYFMNPRALNSNSVSYNYDNRQINQNNAITTTQAAYDIKNELAYANYLFA